MTPSRTSPQVDLVVVSYHTMDDLNRFIASYEMVKGELDTNLIVYLVEATEREIEEVRLWGYEPHWHPDNVGYNGACNLAADFTSAGVVAFFNADTELLPNVLTVCWAELMANSDVGVVGPKQVNRRNQLTHAGIVGSHAAPRHRGWMEMDRGQFNDVLDVVTVSGAAYFIRRDVYDLLWSCKVFLGADPTAAGPWGSFRHYFGDTWLSYHAAAHGYNVRYLGSGAMIHEWHRASPQGGYGEQNWKFDQAKFRSLCDAHGIAHD